MNKTNLFFAFLTFAFSFHANAVNPCSFYNVYIQVYNSEGYKLMNRLAGSLNEEHVYVYPIQNITQEYPTMQVFKKPQIFYYENSGRKCAEALKVKLTTELNINDDISVGHVGQRKEKISRGIEIWWP